MDVSSFYIKAQEYATEIKKQRPEYADKDNQLCLILTELDDIYSGVTSITVNSGTVDRLSADRIALMSVITAQKVIPKQMLLISIDNFDICVPDEETILMLVTSGKGNCLIVKSLEEVVPAISLAPSTAATDFLDGFGDETPQMAAPVPILNNAPIDITNRPRNDASMPFGAPQSYPQTMDNPNAYQNPYGSQQGFSQQNYPQQGFQQNPMFSQQMEYPQQAGFQQPQGYTQQGNYPTQQDFGQQPGYPKQEYPQQQGYMQQQGFPQQGGYPPQQVFGQQIGYPQQGYPQQMGGYPQANPYMNNGGAPFQQSMTSSAFMSGFGTSTSTKSSLLSSQLTPPPASGTAFKKSLSRFLDDDDDDVELQNVSKEDMMKQAQDKKNAAKANRNK